MLKPILFSTPMVQAILAGRKTMTRRVIKFNINMENKKIIQRDGKYEIVNSQGYGYGRGCYAEPRYNPGDILWLRETWCPHTTPTGKWYGYKADGDYRDTDYRWHPSIHMSKEAARIFLRVTDVKVERVQDIFKQAPGPDCDIVKEGFKYGSDFIALWDNLNTGRGYGWDTNPWVWVISFERIEKPADFMEGA